MRLPVSPLGRVECGIVAWGWRHCKTGGGGIIPEPAGLAMPGFGPAGGARLDSRCTALARIALRAALKSPGAGGAGLESLRRPSEREPA
ncbi:hypothetical protein [Schlesneria sp. DSM 10557]|uniref:hypothetical protein n=1 Tax=Schlesneria sp. DSM 10557 TaxID=3044399 RepID=UPI0035A03295